MSNLISFANLLLLLWGRSLWRRHLRLHIWLMLYVIAADLALVIYLVVAHRALEKVTPQMPWTLMLHIPIAVFTLVMYFATAWAGYRLYLDRSEAKRVTLRRLDRVLVPSRVLTLVTSLMVEFI